MTQRHGAISHGISLVIIWKYALIYKVQFSVVVDDEEAKLRTKESFFDIETCYDAIYWENFCWRGLITRAYVQFKMSCVDS
jgi:hypothetical protein